MSEAPNVCITNVQILVFRAPVVEPVRTSFGIMRERPMVLIRIIDSDGISGWGEIWCNFPECAAEHRAHLARTLFVPLLLNRPLSDSAQIWQELTERTRLLAIQSGEPGPFAQTLAGIDIALWDLCARRAGEPLWRFLGGSDPRIRLYASGINPESPERITATRLAEGYRAFKLKIGFGQDIDLRNLRAMRETIGPDCSLMADVNQAWNVERAIAELKNLSDYQLGWVEEPLAADRPWSEWLQLVQQADIPLAAGENLLGTPAYFEAINSSALKILQPDVAKWGGFSGCIPIVRAIHDAGLCYCPHYLGGGIGLLASAHLFAAMGGSGMLEVDANENLLRSALASIVAPDSDGCAVLSEIPGLGPEPNIEVLRPFSVAVW
ncbi:MAG: mandelate racemase [Ferrovum sp. 37-45-19]|nr:MAG: mandelate racemase [Ferrovum sp. 37-45-19]